MSSEEAVVLVAELDGYVSDCAVDTHGSWGALLVLLVVDVYVLLLFVVDV